jgi:hypothetical protein
MPRVLRGPKEVWSVKGMVICKEGQFYPVWASAAYKLRPCFYCRVMTDKAVRNGCSSKMCCYRCYDKLWNLPRWVPVKGKTNVYV